MASQVNLPPPWELKWSKSKSRYYYYNVETKTSQWRPPVKGQSSAIKNAAETVKLANVPSSKSGAIVPPSQVKSVPTKLDEKTKSVEIEGDAKPPKKKRKKRKRSKDAENSAMELEPSRENKVSFVPRVLRVAEPSEAGRNLPERSNVDPKSPTKNLKIGILQSDSKLSLEWKKKSKKRRGRHSAAKRLEDGLESRAVEMESARGQSSSNLPLEKESTKWREEEEEEMEVEYSPEVQMIFQEIQVVREEMRIIKCEEVTSEDVQMIVDNLDNVTSAPQGHSQRLWLVLDTNLFLEDDHLLRDLKAQLYKQFGDGFVFVIPWIVIQEIDRIKDNKRTQTNQWDLQSRARAAVNLIHGWLETKDPNVVGQNPREAARANQVIDGFMVENNDDKILHCCLQCHEKYSSNQVALLTLDKNLRNKGMLLGINTFSKETLNKWLSRTCISVAETPLPSSTKDSPWSILRAKSRSSLRIPVLNRELAFSMSSAFQSSPFISLAFPTAAREAFPPGCNSLTAGFSESVLSGSNNSVSLSEESDFAAKEKLYSDASFLRQQMASIESVMLSSLSTLLETSMKDAYKDLWEEILVVKKPWSICDVLNAINKHWIAVFASFWMRDDRLLFQNLCSSFRSSPDTLSNLSAVLDLCQQLWKSFNPRRWDVQSSREEFTALKKQSLVQLIQFSELEESFKRGTESVIRVNPTLEGQSSLRSSMEMDSSSVATSAASSSVAPAMQVQLGPEEGVVCEDELQRVYDCFDAILKRFILLGDLVKEELSTSLDRPNRPVALQSFAQLGHYICTIHDQYKRALSEDKGVKNSSVYFDLLSTLSSFAHQFNIQVSAISCQALRQFFRDETKRAMVEIGLSQIESLRSSIVDFGQLLTPEELWRLFNK